MNPLLLPETNQELLPSCAKSHWSAINLWEVVSSISVIGVVSLRTFGGNVQ
jgi:hypothetical protein